MYVSCCLFEGSKTESLFAVVIAGASAYCFSLSTYTSLRCMPFEVVSLSPFSRRSSVLIIVIIWYVPAEPQVVRYTRQIRTHIHIQKHTKMKRERERQRDTS